MLSSVDLPEPEGPMIATWSPAGDRLVDVAERVHRLAADLEGARDAARARITALRSAARLRLAARACAPAFTSGRSSDTTTRSPAARPPITSVKSQLRRPSSSACSTRRPPSSTSTFSPSSKRRGRDAQHVVADAQDDLDVGRGPGQQRPRERRVVELDLDLDRAVLLDSTSST